MTELSRPFTFASFNQYLAEHKLMGSQCTNCGEVYLPPRALCSACFSEALEWVQLSGRGRLAAFTSIFIAPTAMVQAGYGRDHPYLSGIVELEEGVKISARLLELDPAEPSDIQIGLPMSVDFIRQGDGDDAVTVLAFRPA